MKHTKDTGPHTESSLPPETVQAELDRQLFHLKTLYDVSRELLGLAEVKAILKNFLLMTMGNFGVAEGFVTTQDILSKEITELVAVGFQESDQALLSKAASRLLVKGQPGGLLMRDDTVQRLEFLPPAVVCVVGFCVDEGCSGFLGLGSKIVGDPYGAEDKDLLETLVNNLVVSLKNARVSEALRAAYEEVSSLNKAKDKVINHLSHEMKTPLASIIGSLTSLRRRLASLPPEDWQRPMERAERNLNRLLDIQSETEDIMQDREYKSRHLLSTLLDQCADELEVLAEEQGADSPVVERIRSRIDEIFGLKEAVAQDIVLARLVKEKIREIRPLFSHRKVDVIPEIEETKAIHVPCEPLEKLVTGLIKNAIENTPDEGKVEVAVRNRGRGMELVVHDYGVGIVEGHRRRIFEGFYPTQETMAYSSRRPFDFNAGGKGADLLRMKISSERFNFTFDMSSSRCRHIPSESDVCPGRISTCRFCSGTEDCYRSGGTTFTAFFPLPR